MPSKKDIEMWLEDRFPEATIWTPDGFEEAFLGIAKHRHEVFAVYDREKCLEILERDMPRCTATEFFEFNVELADMGIGTPVYIERIPE